MSEWISFKDRAPLEGEKVLSNCKYGAIEGCFDGEMIGFTAVMSNYYWKDMEWYATHWMPLPEPPELDEGVD